MTTIIISSSSDKNFGTHTVFEIRGLEVKAGLTTLALFETEQVLQGVIGA